MDFKMESCSLSFCCIHVIWGAYKKFEDVLVFKHILQIFFIYGQLILIVLNILTLFLVKN